jgi:hypothetical protein
MAELKTSVALDGRSLLPLAKGEAAGQPVTALEERRRPTPAGSVIVRSISVRTESTKFILTFDPVTNECLSTEVYDLRSDPQELEPLDGRRLALCPTAFRAVAEWAARYAGWRGRLRW